MNEEVFEERAGRSFSYKSPPPSPFKLPSLKYVMIKTIKSANRT
jgi:hypothetical protein